MLDVAVAGCLGPVERAPDDREDLLAGAEAQRRIVTHPGRDGDDVTFAEHLPADL